MKYFLQYLKLSLSCNSNAQLHYDDCRNLLIKIATCYASEVPLLWWGREIVIRVAKVIDYSRSMDYSRRMVDKRHREVETTAF